MTGHVVVTGGAGFIGSQLVDELLERGRDVVIVDDMSSGHKAFLEGALGQDACRLIERPIEDADALDEALDGAAVVYHLAADPDVRGAPNNPGGHVQSHVVGTFHVLEAMRRQDVPLMCFTSTSTVYGEAEVLPTPEDYAPLEPISIYGAGKLGAEALLSSYCHTYGMEGLSYRFANVTGPRTTHGVVLDFVNKLRATPDRLEVLGDGTQVKSYIHVADCVDAMLYLEEHREKRRYDAYNLGGEDAATVMEIAEVVREAMDLPDASIETTGGVHGGRGWAGDVKHMHLAIDRLKALGWSPKHTSREALLDTAQWVIDHA